MPISDLTGTIWVINSSLSIPADTFIGTNLEFTSNNTNYVGIGIGANPHTEGSRANYIFYDFAEPHSVYANGWSNQADRTLAITGGTDTTNATLIAWLQANAVQVPVADLTGTTWEFIEYPSTGSDTSYNINFSSNSSSYTLLRSYDNGNYCHIWYNTTVVYEDGWLNSNYQTISIISGTDVTNPDLITWLSQNATMQTPVVSNTYEVTHSLTNLSYGNISFTITANQGYVLPSTTANITVYNGTLVSYNNSTGTIVVSGNDTTTISVSCTEAPNAVPDTPTAVVSNGQYLVLQDNSDTINKADTFTATYLEDTTVLDTETIESSKL